MLSVRAGTVKQKCEMYRIRAYRPVDSLGRS